ncbi:MAG TPA: rRNA maturation RNase YbeY [Hyphomicrobiales bacterium]|nr:rRNA maturation RNase YbeY [Hyphomicrobiales bacterium]
MTAAAIIEITVAAGPWAKIADAAAWAERAAQAALAVAGVRLLPGVELSVVLNDDDAVRALNRDWRGKDSATNVLSFPAAGPDQLAAAPHLGDVVLAGETLLREAAAEGRPPHHHLAHLVVHGTLHLLGHDHEDDAEAERMEALERQALATLGVPDPYAEAAPARAAG